MHRPMDDRVQIRHAEPADAAAVARLLHDFNTEFGDEPPGVAALSGYVGELLRAGEATALLAVAAGEPGAADVGVAVLRVRPGLWSGRPEAYLQELYVEPPRRGEGIGRALLAAAMDAARAAGAATIDLNTGETDTAARGLYESAGFTNREGGPDGPAMLYYEREL